MAKRFEKVIQGYLEFREKYVLQDDRLLKKLAERGQKPQVMVVSCCDSRVDPALLLQCDPGDLFIVRNVANLVPPYCSAKTHYGTSAALEFGVCHLETKHIIILGHSQCGGIEAYLNKKDLVHDEYISQWTSLINIDETSCHNVDECAKLSLLNSYHNAMSFPWIKEQVDKGKLQLHLWFFEIKDGVIYSCQDFEGKGEFEPLQLGLI